MEIFVVLILGYDGEVSFASFSSEDKAVAYVHKMKDVGVPGDSMNIRTSHVDSEIFSRMLRLSL